MIKEFNSMEELQPYYNEEINTYVFSDGKYIDVKFNFDVNIKANVFAKNIIAKNIICNNIGANKVIAKSIKANNINVVDKLYCCEINAKNTINAIFIKTREIKANNIYANNIEAVKIIYNSNCFAKTIYTHLLLGNRDNLHYDKLTIKND